MSPNDALKIQDFADLFGFPASAVVQAIEAQRYRVAKAQAFVSHTPVSRTTPMLSPAGVQTSSQ